MKFFFFVYLLLMANLTQAQIFKWTDSTGTIHYSDQPQQGAEIIQQPRVQTYSSPPSESLEKKSRNIIAPTKQSFTYKLFISKPLNNDTIRNNQGLVVIHAKLEPALQKDHFLILFFDNKRFGKPQISPDFLLENVDRGAHELAIAVVNDKEETLYRSAKQIFFMHRPRITLPSP